MAFLASRPGLRWILLGLWLAFSLAALFYFEYQDALRGILCLPGL